MFPDPWPKRRHRDRRLINAEFLTDIRAALREDGELRLTTDDADYFEHMKKAAEAHEGFTIELWPESSDYPQTDFEKRFRAQGLPIHRLLLRKRD
jgi:tRNA (guanine-N7-)-methyltransferase